MLQRARARRRLAVIPAATPGRDRAGHPYEDDYTDEERRVADAAAGRTLADEISMLRVQIRGLLLERRARADAGEPSDPKATAQLVQLVGALVKASQAERALGGRAGDHAVAVALDALDEVSTELLGAPDGLPSGRTRDGGAQERRPNHAREEGR